MPKRVENGVVVKDEGIMTGDDIAPSLNALTHREWMKKMRFASRLARVIMNGRMIDEEPAGKPVDAEINHGRWAAACECGGYELVTPNDPIFFCFSCCNADNDFHVRPVKFPDHDEREAVEAILTQREPKNRNMKKGEDYLQLIEENRSFLDTKGLSHGMVSSDK